MSSGLQLEAFSSRGQDLKPRAEGVRSGHQADVQIHAKTKNAEVLQSYGGLGV